AWRMDTCQGFRAGRTAIHGVIGDGAPKTSGNVSLQVSRVSLVALSSGVFAGLCGVWATGSFPSLYFFSFSLFVGYGSLLVPNHHRKALFRLVFCAQRDRRWPQRTPT